MKNLKDKQGRFLTMSLFKETNTNDKFEPFYTLKEEELEGLPSAYNIYMNAIDEYEAAMILVGNIRHWDKLCASKWFMEGIDTIGFPGLSQWRKDKDAKDKSDAKRILKKLAAEGNVQAAKLLFKGEESDGRGRPKKADVSKEARKIAEESRDLIDLKDRFKAVSNEGK